MSFTSQNYISNNLQIYLHKLWIINIKFLIAKKQQYLYYKKSFIKKILVAKNLTLKILKIIIKIWI